MSPQTVHLNKIRKIDISSTAIIPRQILPSLEARVSGKYRIGHSIVKVDAEPPVQSYLLRFYSSSDGTPDICIRCKYTAESSVSDRPIISWTRPDEAVVSASTPILMALYVRRALRTIYLKALSCHPWAMLHASAFYRQGHMIILVGDKMVGKTTLALQAVLSHGYGLISNDHLILINKNNSIEMTTYPTVIPTKLGTLDSLRHILPPNDLAAHLLDNLDNIEQDPSTSTLFRRKEAAYYTYLDLGAEPIPYVTADNLKKISMIYPKMNVLDCQCDLSRIDGGISSLSSHWREDWFAEKEQDNRPHRQAATVLEKDSVSVIERVIANKAIFYEYRHNGDVGPLIKEIG